MRFRSLELKAFGPFTDRHLDLAAGTGLQLVYGANEAGKSSALRGISNLLFGFGHQTPDDHLHTGPSLRIGACVENGSGERLLFFRRKGRTQTLRDASDEPIDEEALRPFLGGADQAFFERVFGLDHERLRRGGQQILDAGGELGLSLFGAATGIVELAAVLAGLEKSAGDLFLPSGRKPLVNEAIAALAEARKRMRAAQLSSETWRKKRSQVEEKEREHAEQVAEIQRLEADRTRLERIDRNLPRLAERRERLRAITELGELPDLAADAGERRLAAQRALRDALRDRERAGEEASRLEEKLADRDPPAALLAHAEEIDLLAQQTGAIAKADADRPKLEASCQTSVRRVKDELGQAGFPVPPDPTHAVLPTAPAIKALRELIRRGTDLAGRAKDCRDRVRRAQESEARARAALGELAAPRDMSALAAALRPAERPGDLEEHLRQAQEQCSVLAVEAARVLARLSLWIGDLESLAGMAIPSDETVARFVAREHDVRSRLQRDEERLAGSRAEIARLDADLGRLVAQGEVPSPEALDRARGRRDAAWRLLRRGWMDGHEDVAQAARGLDATLPLPDAYERLVAEADHLADRRHAEAARVAEEARLLADLDAERAELGRAEDAAAQSRVEVAALLCEWQVLWEPSGIAPLSPREMQGWLGARLDLVRRADAIAQSRQATERLAARIAASRDDLLRALDFVAEPCGDVPATLEALITHCKAVLEREAELVRQRQGHSERIAEQGVELAHASSDLTTLEEKQRQWQELWAAALAPLGRSPADGAAEIEEVIARLAEAGKGIDQWRADRSRILHMAENADAFAARVADLVPAVAPDLAGKPPVEAAWQLAERLAEARKDCALREELQGNLARQRSLAEQAEPRIADTQRELDQLCTTAGCDSAEELEEIEKRVAALRARREQLAGLERTLLEGGAGLSLEELAAEAEAAAADRDALRAQLAALEAGIEPLQLRRDELARQAGALRTELGAMDAGDAAACAAQDAEDTLARLRYDAERFVQLRLAELVLRRAIDRYKERNQGPILARARELFAEFTRGAYERLTVDYDDPGRPQLQGVTGDGRVRSVAQMSDGTRDQLYLALRLAVIERHLEAGQRLPLVVDDLLLHFDDERARQALVVLAELGCRTQVLFFTHHRHLVELARQALPASAYAVQEL